MCLSYNLAGGGLCLVFFLWWLAAPASPVAFIGVFAGYVVVGGIVASRQDRARADVVLAWLTQGRHPNAKGRAVVLGEPLRQAWTSLAVWVGGCVLFAATYVAYTDAVFRGAVLLAGALLGGMHIAAVVFLLCERGLRPIAGVALQDGLPGGPGWLSVQRRLQLAWASGSGIPLLGIAVALLWDGLLADDGADMMGPLWALVITGLAAGYLAITGAARAVAEPMSRVRSGLLQVQRGDLDAEVAVDDSSEIGMLQSGFNRMVLGLREAQRVNDLFGRHVGTAVARQAMAREVDFKGEMGEASILFVDLVGSTPLTEQGSPHDVMAMLNALFRVVVRTVEAEGGWINRFQGDAALCVFGPPAPMPDHASRALRAAVRVRDDIDRLHAAFPELDVGIGVSSGMVVTGYLGADNRYEFGVVGDAANEAARLSDEAKRRAGRVLAAASSVAGAGADWTECATVQLRGRSAPSRVYEPTVARSAR